MSDLINRQDAIDALANGALINYQAAGHHNGLVKAIDVIKGLPSAEPTQTNTPIALKSLDCISRQAAIDALRYAQHRFTVADEAGGMGTVKWSEDVIYFAAAERVLTDLPSAQPEPKTGRWKSDRLVFKNGGTYGVRRCSECGAYYQDIGYGWNFCPNCGSRMEDQPCRE